MMFSDNLFNWVDMIRLDHINNIATEDFTLNELEAFELFLYRIGTAYGAKLDEEHGRFGRMLEDYRWLEDDIEPDTAEAIEYLDNAFFNLKLEVEEMAGILVFDKAPSFFSEARRAIE